MVFHVQTGASLVANRVAVIHFKIRMIMFEFKILY